MPNVARTGVNESPEMQRNDKAIRKLTLVFDGVPLPCCTATDTLTKVAPPLAQRAESVDLP
jgi:hypothetical protein